jgi:dUTP pyrophosphatase
MNTWLKLERLPNNDLPTPEIATVGSAGIDFYACLKRPCRRIISKTESYDLNLEVSDSPSLIVHPDETIGIPLGFKSQFDSAYVMLLFIRSSAGLSGLMLANLVGVIDSDYRGELIALLYNRTQNHIKINHGDRIVQGLMFPLHQVLITEESVSDSARGAGGFGSTGS